MFNFDGPFGAHTTFKSRPLWSFPIEGNSVQRVDLSELEPIVDGYARRVESYISEEYVLPKRVDVEDLADVYERVRQKAPMLIDAKSAHIPDPVPMNTFDVDPEEVASTSSKLTKDVDALRKLIVNHAMSNAAMDIASAQAGSMLSDILESEVTVDDDMLEYLNVVGDADILTFILGRTSVPEVVRNEALKDFMLKGFESVRVKLINKKRLENIRRISSKYDSPIGHVKQK